MVLLGGSKSELVMQKICFRPVTDRLGWTNLSRHIYEHLGHFKKNKHQQKPNEYVYDVLSLSLSLLSWAGFQVQPAKIDQIQTQIWDCNFTWKWIHELWIELAFPNFFPITTCPPNTKGPPQGKTHPEAERNELGGAKGYQQDLSRMDVRKKQKKHEVYVSWLAIEWFNVLHIRILFVHTCTVLYVFFFFMFFVYCNMYMFTFWYNV